LAAEDASPPTLAEIRDARAHLGDLVRETPVWHWQGHELDARLGNTQVFLKLELFQHAGTFKPRAALMRMLALDPEERTRGVTTVSAGNHAMATAYAARVLGTTVKVVMPRNASSARIIRCRALGAEVELVDHVHHAFSEARRIEAEEGRTFVHPFDGKHVALGTATLGLELCEAVPELDAVVVPIGGGGLCAGVSTAVKLIQPRCRVYGVEPEGADTMHRSFASGRPEAIDEVRTIADSLGAPHAENYSFGLCRRHVDELALVSDVDMCEAMGLLFREMKLAVEPAGAAATTALLGPLREKLLGRRVALVVCGTNIDRETFCRYLTIGEGNRLDDCIK
jgi:threonine dehydratase